MDGVLQGSSQHGERQPNRHKTGPAPARHIEHVAFKG
jgi:hypothetical protein